MKYVVILADGMADYKVEELGSKTPLQYAKTPNFDYLAAKGEVGLVSTIPQGMPPGSDTANLAVRVIIQSSIILDVHPLRQLVWELT